MNPNMSPVDWAKRPLQKYADFSGRAPRAELWWYCLLVVVAAIVAMIVESMLGIGNVLLMYGPLTLLIVVGTFVPTLAVQVRRLHDRNQPGWWLLAFYGPYFVMLAMTPSIVSPDAAAPSMGSAGLAMLLGLAVMVIAIVLLVFYVLPGTPGDNRYGPDPYGREGAPAAA